jgi:cell division transport system permease protein
LVTLFVVAVALLLPALLFGLSSNLASLLAGFQDSAQVTLYLHDDVSEADGQEVSDNLLTRSDIESTYYVSSSQALDEFSAASGLEDLLQEMTSNPLPGAIVLTPADVSPAAVDELARQLQELPQVDVAQVDSLWLQRLAAISNLISAIGSVLAVIVILGLFFVVGNTVKLAIENRKAEIRVIKLVGGSDMYAARPFLYMGLFYGLGGGILATLLQGIVLIIFNSNLEVLLQLYESDFQLRGFGFMNALLIVVAGAAIGWAAALMASLRHIRAINP